MPTVKLVLIGASGVGKTSIRSKYISGQFSTSYRATIGADFITKTLPHPSSPDQSVTLQIWDTAGQERFSSLSSAFFRGADAAVLMFDVNEPRTMDALVKWWDEFKTRAPLADEDAEDYCCIVVGNKIDADESSGVRVTEAAALRFLNVLVPSSPRLAPDIEEPSLPIDTQSLPTTAITIAAPPLSPSSQPYTRQSVASSSRFQGGTITSMRSIYHTPSSSLFEHYHSAQASPEPSSDVQTRPVPESSFSSESPERLDRRSSSASSGASGSAVTMTPSLFARSTDTTQIDNSIATDMTTFSAARPKTPDRYPRLFFTSAKTGEGVAEVFEYIARRVVTKWEYEAAMDARVMHVRETSAADTIRLGLAGFGNGARRPMSRDGTCCSS